MPSVYIESSVVSYYTARLSSSLEVAARQSFTQRVWPRLISEFHPYVSALVLQEIAKGDPGAAVERLQAVKDLDVLTGSPEAERMTQDLLKAGLVPMPYAEDAAHIAIASTSGIDFLVTWNFSHLNNVVTRNRIQLAVEALGYVCVELCSPEELFGEEATYGPDC